MKPRLKKLINMQKMIVRCKERHSNDKKKVEKFNEMRMNMYIKTFGFYF